MCGRFDQHTLDILPNRYHVEIPKYHRSYNVAPSMDSIIITSDDAEVKKFGILAPWDEKKRLINARSETIDEKRTFKKLFETQRCILPVNGYFEWKRTDGKVPFYFHVKGEELFSLAAIYGDDGFVILTTDAGKVMSPIHHREPVILDKDEEEVWLNPDTDPMQALKLLDPFHGKLEMWEVSKDVNSPANNFEKLLEPVYRKRT